MAVFQILHNPHCSKSRACLQLLEARGVQIAIRRYLESPLTLAELQALRVALGGNAREMLRSDDPAACAAGLDDPALSDAQLLQGIADSPALMQRPIVIVGDRALLCRPPERVVALL